MNRSAFSTTAIALALLAGPLLSSIARSADDGSAPTAATVARGHYLVTIAGCNDCHTPLKMGPAGPEPDMDRMLSGHPQSLAMPAPPKLPDGPWLVTAAATNTAWSGPWGVSFTANLTPDPETGLGRWTLRSPPGPRSADPAAHAVPDVQALHGRGFCGDLRLPAHDPADPQPGARAAASAGRRCRVDAVTGPALP